MRLKPLLILTLLSSPCWAFAGKGLSFVNPSQKAQKADFDPDKLVYGGNFGLQLGNPTLLDISPMIGYQLHERLISGVGGTYAYFSLNSPNYSYKTNLYGARLFSMFFVVNNIFVHGELEFLNFDYYDPFLFDRRRYWFTTPMLGVGYTTNGSEGGFMASVLFAFRSDEEFSPYYQNPLVYRIGFLF